MSIRTRMSGGVTTARDTAAERIEAVADTIYVEGIYAGMTATFLVTLMSLVVPIIPFFEVITGGVVGGFIAAYATGGLVRGAVHGTVAAVIGGVLFAGFTIVQGLLLGLVFLEAPTLIGQVTPPISGVLSRQPLIAILGILVVSPLLVGFDGAVGGVIGSGVKWLRNRAV